MQAATHLAGAALFLVVARGFGMEFGPFETGALFLGSLLPDIDTTTAGAGRYVQPLSRWIEAKYGHRGITHSLAFAVAVSLPFWLLWPGVGLALFLGIFSHLLLDTMNMNGLPYLLWPVRLTFWFMPGRSTRIRYGSGQETTLAVCLALSGVALWPLSTNTFSTEVRRLIASPETAVVDYVRWRDDFEVYAQISGFNSQTQEKIDGRYRVVEALGRSGVLVEDDNGNAYQVSENGQIVAYRVRVQKGRELSALDSRVSVGGRLLRDVLTAVPAQARAYFTGELELSAPVNVHPVEAGTFPRVAGSDRLVLHSARPADLAEFATSYVIAGSLVVRVAGQESAALAYTLPAVTARTEARTVNLSGLPSLAAVLVEQGAEVLPGQPLARYIQTADLAELDAQAEQKRAALAQARGAAQSGRVIYQAQRDALTAQLAPVQREAETLRTLYKIGAEPLVKVEEAEARARAVTAQVQALAIQYSTAAAGTQAQADALALDLRQLTEKRARAEIAQVVRSPIAGRVAEVRVLNATQAGVSVDVVLISEVAESAANAPPLQTNEGGPNEEIRTAGEVSELPNSGRPTP